MPEHDAQPSGGLEPLRKDPFPDLTAVGDPALRLVAWLILNKDFRQLEQRTGIRMPASKPVRGFRSRLAAMFRSLLRWFRPEKKRPYLLPVLLQFDTSRGKPRILQALHDRYGVPKAYGAAMERNAELAHATARLPLQADIFRGSVDSLIAAVVELRSYGVSRISLGAPGQPSRQRESLVDIGLPANRAYKTKVLNGDGVIVGIIDDGCALAHRDFLKPTAPGAPIESRILYLWDQAGTGDTAAGWTQPADFDGLELDKNAIDAALHAAAIGDLVREDLVYSRLGYPVTEVSSHGTHVMDIAAGTGRSLMTVEGVAPGADIIFVQLPKPAIEEGATALARHVVDGVTYILERAKSLNKPAVVNISYGGYDGPHDGTSELERTLDELLAEPNGVVVLAAGNGFEARCHAMKNVSQNQPQSFGWIVNAEDPTANDVELWYDDKSTLAVRLRPPSGAIDPGGWVPLGQARTPITRDGRTIGYLEHLASGTGNAANCIVISLNATDRAADTATTAPAPSGMWHVDLQRVSGPAVDVHAWIWRDDSGRARDARRRQSRFHPQDADPTHTIAGWATGQRTISVGAYNWATREVCRYSACGPTRRLDARPGRKKPEIYAPAEEEVRGRGALSASTLSAKPRRMNGTSAAAPHATGVIALMFEYARKHAVGAPVSLTADQICTELKAAAQKNVLDANRHQAVDARVLIKQKQVFGDLVPTGKTDFTETMKKFF